MDLAKFRAELKKVAGAVLRLENVLAPNGLLLHTGSSGSM